MTSIHHRSTCIPIQSTAPFSHGNTVYPTDKALSWRISQTDLFSPSQMTPSSKFSERERCSCFVNHLTTDTQHDGSSQRKNVDQLNGIALCFMHETWLFEKKKRMISRGCRQVWVRWWPKMPLSKWLTSWQGFWKVMLALSSKSLAW